MPFTTLCDPNATEFWLPSARPRLDIADELVPVHATVPNDTRLATRPYQGQLRQSPKLPQSYVLVVVTLGALPISS